MSTENYLGRDFARLPIPERFNKTRARILEITSDMLPNPLPLYVYEQTDCISLFQVALDNWQFRFNKEGLIPLVTRLNHPNTSYRDSFSYQSLKELRVFGTVLRSAYSLFSQEHWTPETFYTLIRIMGQLNDKYYSEEVNPVATELLSLLDGYDDKKMHSDFCPASVDSFYTYLTGLKDFITGCLSQNQLPFSQLHTLRKDHVRHFMHLYRIAAVQTGENRALISYQYLRSINDILGSALDSEQDRQATIPFPEEAQLLLSAFLEKLQL